MSSPAFSEDDIAASLCKDSFYEFVKEFWHVIISDEPVWNWHIKFLCDELQVACERVFNGEPKKHDLLVNISPGSTKSTICSRMLPAWIWTRMASAKVIGASFGTALALSLAGHNKDIVDSDQYKRWFPDVKIRRDSSAKGAFQNTKGGERRAYGTGSSIVGFHGHFIIVDDPIDPLGASSEADLKTVNKWMQETIPTRKVDKAVTLTIVIMQRLNQNDPSGVMIKKGPQAVRHLCLPARLSPNVKPRTIRKHYVDGLMDPIRLSEVILQESLEALGNYGFAGQFEQSPVPLTGGMFKPERLAIDNPHRKFKQVVRYWDKAGTKDGGCRTAGVKLGLDVKGRFWILDVVTGQWEATEREEAIKATAEIDGRSVRIGIEQEGGSGGKESAQATVKNLAGWSVKVDRPVGDKALRADPFSVQVGIGNVSMVKAPWNELYVDEMRFFPNSKFKDQIDATSGAFAMLNKPKKKVGALRR